MALLVAARHYEQKKQQKNIEKNKNVGRRVKIGAAWKNNRRIDLSAESTENCLKMRTRQTRFFRRIYRELNLQQSLALNLIFY